jgi:hypothetical protein
LSVCGIAPESKRKKDLNPALRRYMQGRENEQKSEYDMCPVKRCRGAFRDSDGVEHAIEVEARTLYEAVGLAIDRFRRCEHVPYDPKGMHEFIVESREPSTEHRLTRKHVRRMAPATRRIARRRGA